MTILNARDFNDKLGNTVAPFGARLAAESVHGSIVTVGDRDDDGKVKWVSVLCTHDAAERLLKFADETASECLAAAKAAGWQYSHLETR